MVARWMRCLVMAGTIGWGSPAAMHGQTPECDLQTVQSTLNARRMPEVEGCQLAAIVPMLKKADLYVLQPTTVAGAQAAGQIVKQYPLRDSVMTGEKRIQLTVSDGTLAKTGSAYPPPVKGVPDLSINGALDTAAPYRAGQTIGYTLYVNNGGPVTASGVEVKRVGSENLEILSVSGRTDDGPVAACSVSSCVIPYVRPQRGVTVNVTARVPAAGRFSAVSRVDAAEGDSDQSNNRWAIEASAEQPAGTGPVGEAGAGQGQGPSRHTNRLPDVFLERGEWPQDTARTGDHLTVSLVVTNRGPGLARGVLLATETQHLKLTPKNYKCAAPLCRLENIGPYATTTVVMDALVEEKGPYLADFTLRSADRTPLVNAGHERLTGVALSTWPGWIGWGGGGLAMLGLGALATRWRQRRWWTAHAEVTVSAPRAAATGECGPLAFIGPAVAFEVNVLDGPAGPDGDVPILGKEIVHE